MITSLIEMLDLPNVFRMTASTIYSGSLDETLLVKSWTKNHVPIIFISKTFMLRRPRVAIFADINKIVTMFIKTIFEDSKKVKRIKNYISKCNLYLYFWYNKICWFSVKNADISITQNLCHVIHICLNLL